MCTLTIIPALSQSLHARVVMNRDEQRTRPHALPPRIHSTTPAAIATLPDDSPPSRQSPHTPRCIMPTDPQSGGTWIAATDAGLIFALLNVNPPSTTPPLNHGPPRLSRGLIIPRLALHTSITRAASAALALDLDRFPPFRLVITDGTQLIELVSSAVGPTLHHTPRLASPFFATSSGLGDHHVDPPRREQFNVAFANANPTDWPDLQDAFHLSRFEEAPHLGVLMSRREASTVSITCVDLRPSQITVRYHHVDDQFAQQPSHAAPITHTLILDRSPPITTHHAAASGSHPDTPHPAAHA